MRSFFCLCATLSLVACQDDGGAEDVVGDGATDTDTNGDGDQVCRSPEVDEVTDLLGTWTGSLSLEQLLEGQLGDVAIDATIEFSAYAAPTNKIPGMGMIGPWSVYASGGGFPLRLEPLYENGGVGMAWAYNQDESDGPANGLEFRASEMCVTDSSFDWVYEVAYLFVDLIDYELYDYLQPETPMAVMQGHDHFELDGDTLRVEASAVGSDADGNPIELHVNGVLTRQ